ncbi:hypothetical protein BV25DRAFT_1842155 [Artomyces pyxidatus]|uniref:Uncharacterized protein n=1 Tax=Artomyces pyxidatus TaxID=48021 RepID=A0ACB8SLJ4_9AGAM|nr:hypothetical protein BV25DRAFT_1842155 [Artomyces pyxidatus]
MPPKRAADNVADGAHTKKARNDKTVEAPAVNETSARATPYDNAMNTNDADTHEEHSQGNEGSAPVDGQELLTAVVLPVAPSPKATPTHFRWRPYYSEHVLQAIRSLVRVVLPHTGLFAASVLPAKTFWSASDRLCLANTTTPVVVSLIGELTKMWFFDKQSVLQMNVSTTVRPSDTAALTGMKQLVRDHSTIKKGLPSIDITDIYASALSSDRPRGSTETVAVPFPNIFDASAGIKDKKDLPRIPSEQLAIGDLVIQEFFVNRYKIAAEGSRVRDCTRVSFEMRSITLLAPAPARWDFDDEQTVIEV